MEFILKDCKIKPHITKYVTYKKGMTGLPGFRYHRDDPTGVTEGHAVFYQTYPIKSRLCLIVCPGDILVYSDTDDINCYPFEEFYRLYDT